MWQWGCWEITHDQTSGFWCAFDILTDFGWDPSYELIAKRLVIGGFSLSSVRWFLWELDERGNRRLTTDQVNALREELAAQS